MIVILRIFPPVRNSLLFKSVMFYIEYSGPGNAIMRALGMVFVAVGLIIFPLITRKVENLLLEERKVTDGN